MKIGLIGILQESNTFLKGPNAFITLDQFEISTGDLFRERFQNGNHELSGFFTIDRAGFEVVPLLAARALPNGPLKVETAIALLSRLDRELDQSQKLDGLFVAPHGATVAEKYHDFDGEWLSRLRARFGSGFPIIGTVDPHGNLSPKMVAATDALMAYRTNPHLDQRERGEEAARLMARTLKGEIAPVQAACFPRVAINIERQRTSEEPCRSWYRLREEISQRTSVLSASNFLCFPYADVPEMGSAALVVTDGDRSLAQNYANELGHYLWTHRELFRGVLISAEEALLRACEISGTVGLLDMGDNVGGGSPGDLTLLLHQLNQSPLSPWLACLQDPENVVLARESGVGSRLLMDLGGKSGVQGNEPFRSLVTVRKIWEGRFEETQVRHGGFSSFDQGETAIVETDRGDTIMLTTHRMVPFSLSQWTSCGIDPSQFRAIVIKGVHAPIAAYEPVCEKFIRVNTAGPTTADLHSLEYQNRRVPLFPFEDESERP